MKTTIFGKLISVWLVLALLMCAVPAFAEESTLSGIDMSAWQYNADDDVYWQCGIVYCASPADASYETLGIYVPGAYMTGTDNGDGTWTCTVNPEGQAAGYTAADAPIVIPVNTPGYSAMAAPTGYASDAADYTGAGFVYVWAGCRGRDAGAPAGVTDLKAAVRYIRSCGDSLPGSTDRIFTFGMSGGGAQSALMGVTGDSDLYTPYLQAIGAVMDQSDAVAGSMCWCPITSLDTGDEAYEWCMGVSRSGLDEETQALSDGLAAAYTDYINSLGLTDENGTVLTLDGVADGVEDTGTYIEALRSLIERSLNNFLADTEFPYTVSSGKSGMGGGKMPSGGLPSGDAPADLPSGNAPADLASGDAPADLPSGDAPADTASGNGTDGSLPTDEDWAAGTVDDGVQRTGTTDTETASGTYETAADYIAALNGDDPWVEYDETTGTVTVTGIAGFIKACKSASKSVGAFDDLNETQAENILFGDGDGEGDHFDATMAALLADTEYGEAYAQDLLRTDSLGTDVQTRLNMYSPLYYLISGSEGYGTSTVAKWFRIRTGITQGDTALNTEMNLALALENYGSQVDFETVWGQGHTQAERTGTSTENFIAWVNECLAR